MTDQGQGYPPYGEPGAGGQPPDPTQQFPQQPQYPGQPGYGEPHQPQQPQYPTQQFPAQPQYPGQPGYGQPQQPQYPGQPGYGTPPPGYPPPGYGGPGGPTGPGGPGGVGAAGGGMNRKGLLAAGAAAVVVAAAVVAYFIFSGGSASASTPKDAVKKLLEAGKSNDINAAKKVLCKGDIALGTATDLGSSGKILSYTIGKESKKNGVTVIEVTASTSKDPTPSSAEFPVVKEGGSWKVCFTKLLPTGLPTGLPSAPTDSGPPTDTGSPSDTGAPTDTGFPSSSGLPSGLPSGISICSASSSALTAAEAYIGAAEIGLTDYAQSCVYQNSVPASVTASLKDTLYVPPSGASSGDTFVFKSVKGDSTVTVKITKEADGHFYVTGVQKG
ncbi:MAG: hypothetical protein DLM58_18215 [Pseudonocardiales bacterium]|nr:MAG: hypothetical protein DLM58_18215 [Pseudonocardiales bacterium]